MEVLVQASDERWRDDMLRRRQDGLYVVRFLLGRLRQSRADNAKASFVLNIDAGWGEGKTYFLDRLGADLKEQEVIVARVDAWRDDFATDPLIPILGAVEDAIAPMIAKEPQIQSTWEAVRRHGLKIAAAALRGAALKTVDRLVGQGAEEIADLLGDPTTFEQRAEGQTSTTTETLNAAGDGAVQYLSGVQGLVDRYAAQALDDFRKTKKSMLLFREQLERLLAGRNGLPPTLLVVLIDELDRCRPSYAISTLERMKHLFGIDHVGFVVATDTDQLIHAIGAVYGDRFDARGYLRRFFNRSYKLTRPRQVHEFVAKQMQMEGADDGSDTYAIPSGTSTVVYLSFVFREFGCTLRDIEQSCELLQHIAHQIRARTELKTMVQICALAPLLIGMQKGIRPALTEAFWDELEATNGVPGSYSFWLQFPESVGHDSNEITPKMLFNALVRANDLPLSELKKRAGVGGLDGWAASQALNEISMDSEVPRVDTVRPIGLYPEIVLRAGRHWSE